MIYILVNLAIMQDYFAYVKSSQVFKTLDEAEKAKNPDSEIIEIDLSTMKSRKI